MKFFILLRSILALQKSLILLGVLLYLPATVLSQKDSLSSLLKENSYQLTQMNGSLAGNGIDFLMESTTDAQFVAIAEEHNVMEIPRITTMLFKALHEKYDYNYLALEQGPVISRMFSDESKVGNSDSVFALAKRFTAGVTFVTDQELEMIATVGRNSTGKGNRIWGLDQEFGAFHILDRLEQLAISNDVRQRVRLLKEEAHKYEKNRFSTETHFLAQVANPKDYIELQKLFRPGKGSEADFLIHSLQVSSRIYRNNVLAGIGKLTGYQSNLEREEYMKSRFIEEYRIAQAAGDALPKVLLKLGHWHIRRGKNRGNTYTIGNFASEFARSNSMRAFILSCYIVSGEEEWRIIKGPLAEAGDPNSWMIIDFRPIRAYAHAGKIKNLSDGMKSRIFMYDAALLLGGSKAGTYSITRDENANKP